MTDVVAEAAAAHPEGEAWRDLGAGGVLTLGRWDADANRMARGLRAAGVGPGDRVVLGIGPEHPFPWLVTYVAVHRAGAAAVPVSTRLAAAELRAVEQHAEAALVVDTGGAGGDHAVGSGSGGRRAEWDTLLDDDPSPLPWPAPADRAVDVMYTSGTTGTPKAVVARAGSAQPRGRPARWNGLGFLTCSPFSTTSGILLVDGPVRSGMSGWYLPRFDPGHWLELVEQERPVAAFLVPAMAQLLVAHPRFAEADLRSLAALTFGGAPVPRATLVRLAERLEGAEVFVGYGLTEFGAVSRTPAGDQGRHLGSVGTPLEGVEVRVVGEDGAERDRGQVGEVTVRGPLPPRHYFKDEAATGRTWRDGWLHTGDLGYLDADGFLWITGRAKDVIIRGGNNIVPRDVEEVLFAHPDVVDAVVVGIPHDVLGEDVATWIVLRDHATVTADDVRAFLGERLADYKVPRTVHFVPELPRNASGKVVPSKLRGQEPRP
ncbi:MAG: AMP-binding protein [Acidimicrobiales bacterium]|nr:AMP-binding protein [Acidimicrobiales bacterium]